jgi:hypothetical protein
MLYDGSASINFTELAADVFDGAYSVSVNRQTYPYVKGWCTAQGKVIAACHNQTGCEKA